MINRANQTSNDSHVDSDSLGVSMCSESTTHPEVDEDRTHLERPPTAPSCADNSDELSRSDIILDETLGETSELDVRPQDRLSKEESSTDETEPAVEARVDSRSKWQVVAVSMGL